MDGRWIVGLVAILPMISGFSAAAEGPEGQPDAFVARLIRPDRQAAEILRLFDGARWSHPAAALSAWRTRSPQTGPGKAIEALIASFNPEMVREWRSMDGAEVRIGMAPSTGEVEWAVLVPHDDGTLAAGVTAIRLTNPEDPPIEAGDGSIPVARIGRSGVPMACQIGGSVVVAGSRAWLERGAAIVRARGGPASDSAEQIDSGLVFRLEPARLPSATNGSLDRRRVIEAIRALGCGQIDGRAFLKDGGFVLDVSARFEGRTSTERGVEPAWLESIPTAGAMAALSIAVDPDPSGWDRAFGLADRVERVDPTRAGLAPLRTRLNLLAIASGVRWESELRPHLLGISACLLGVPDRPGKASGILIVLHLDDAATAVSVARRASLRLSSLAIEARDREIRIGWGETSRRWVGKRPAPGESLSAIIKDSDPVGSGRVPSRVVAAWPGRILRLTGAIAEAGRTLAEDPPIIWRGWDLGGRTHDVARWNGLGDRVRRFLAAMPGDRAIEAAETRAAVGVGGAAFPDSRGGIAD